MAAEEDAEKTQKNMPNSRQQHSALATANFDGNDDQNIRGNDHELFGSLSLMRRRRMRGSAHQKRSESSNLRSWAAKKKMTKAMDKQREMEMTRAVLIASLLMLAGICAVHLLLFADNNPPTGLTSKHQNGIDAGSHRGHPLPVDHSIIPKIRKRADQLVQRQLEKLTEDLARLPANFYGFQQTTNQMPPFRVNMLLTEHRRRNAVQRPRSATPIPSMGTNLPISTHRQSRDAARASNSENWPPQHLTEPSTSGQQMEVGEEPTLMDYDAIDAYWRWDIEQEKEPTSVLMQQSRQYPHNNNNFQFGQQQPQHWMPSAQNGEPGESATEMLLYERDIQLLTEKTQFPELSIFGQNDGPSTGLVPLPAGEDEEYLLSDISQNKWEMPPQWPTTSSRENQQFGGPEFGLENDQNNEGNEILWTTQGIGKLVPFQTTGGNNNVDEGIGTELWNIPVVTPPPGTILDSEHQQQNVPPIGAEEEAPPSSPNSCLQFPQFIPSPQQTSFDRPILFRDVSLAEAAHDLEDTDGHVEEILSNLEATQFSNQFSSTTAAFSNPNFSQFQSPTTEPQTEEEEDEMLLSTLFPQLFHPNGPAENGGDPLVPFPIQRSPSLSSVLSDGANANLEVILRELATAELLLNASNMAAAISPSHPLSPLQIPLTLQTPQAFTQQAYFPPIGAFPSIGLNSFSPILEQLNQTQQQLINVPSSSAGLATSSLLAPSPDHDLFCLPQSRISARCSSTTSSGFGSSGPDTLASTSPSFGFSPVALPDDSNPQNSPIFREDKLVPKAIKMEKKGKNGGNSPGGNANVEMERPKAKGKRGRRSKDDSLVNQHGLPFSAERLAAMSYREYATLMADGRLTGEQKAMIKKIRRRGRNKLAARKCRERRLNTKGEEDGEEDEFNGEGEEDEIIDVGQPQIYGEDEDSNQSSSLENFYEEEMKYEPAGISLYPSTSTASQPQQMMIPNKMRSGQNPKTIKQDNQPDKAAAIRVQF